MIGVAALSILWSLRLVSECLRSRSSRPIVFVGFLSLFRRRPYFQPRLWQWPFGCKRPTVLEESIDRVALGKVEESIDRVAFGNVDRALGHGLEM